MKHSKTKTSFYRRLYIAYLIDTGTNTVPAISAETGMARRTTQDTIKALHELGIQCNWAGPTKSGGYEIIDWGPIRKGWIKSNLKHVIDVLERG
ncbi:helix-turn-helix domain-containing protein [Pseudomonadota bacterium]